MPRKIVLPFTCVLALALAVCGAAATPTTAVAAAQTRTVATAATVEARVVVTARRTGGGSAPTASVTVATYRRAAGAWRRTASHRLTGLFWHTVTAPHALCRLSLVTTGKSHVDLQLLLSPSLGCGAVHTYPLPDAR